MSKSTVIDNLNISSEFTDNKIKFVAVNKDTYECYETKVCDKDNFQKNFDLEGLHNFFLKCLNNEDGHKFSYTINQLYLKITMEAVFNTYFHMVYDLKLNKKILSSEELLNNVTTVIVKQDKRIEELNEQNIKLKSDIDAIKKDYDLLNAKFESLHLNYDTLNNIVDNVEMNIGIVKNEQNQITTLKVPLNTQSLKYNIVQQVATYYYDKIQLLTKLKTIYLFSGLNFIQHNKNNLENFNFEILVTYCKNKNIQLYVDNILKVDFKPQAENIIKADNIFQQLKI
jgi:hypothetical protein